MVDICNIANGYTTFFQLIPIRCHFDQNYIPVLSTLHYLSKLHLPTKWNTSHITKTYT